VDPVAGAADWDALDLAGAYFIKRIDNLQCNRRIANCVLFQAELCALALKLRKILNAIDTIKNVQLFAHAAAQT
jgi:hypothetical protein